MKESNYLKKELYELIKNDESIFDFIQECSLDGLWYWDLENPENEWMNAKFWTELGYNPKDMPHKASAWQNIINKDDLKLAIENFNKHCENPNHPYDQLVRYKHKNGNTVWIRCKGIAIRNKNGKPVRMLGAHHNVTDLNEQKVELLKLNEDLKLSRLKYKSLTEEVLDKQDIGVFILDANFKVVWINKTIELFFGIKRNEIIGTDKKETIENKIKSIFEDSDEFEKKVFATYNNNTYVEEFTCTVKESEKLKRRVLKHRSQPIEDGLFKGGRVEYYYDITEQLKAEKEAKESFTRFKALHNASFGGITIHDKGIILDCNKGLSEMTGYSYEELIGMDGLLLIAESTRDFVMSQILKGVETPYEAMGVRKNGEEYPVRLEARNIPYKGNQVRTVEFRDITQQKKYEEELIKSKLLAEEANRLKTEFLKNMSHEVRTPMNGIIGFSKMLNKPNITSEQIAFYTHIIENSGKQLLKIIDDILQISILETKQETIEVTDFNLNELLEELASVFELKAKEFRIPVKLSLSLTKEKSNISSDKSKIHKIISNLLSNSLKFTKKGFIELGYNIDSNNIIMYVKDTGVGIKPENHEAIFERFSQEEKEMSREYGGLGLGLAISKENADLIGGTISLESEKGKGSTFYLTIPYKPANNITQTRKSKIGLKGIKNRTILIAEDDKINYLFLEALIKEEAPESLNILHAKNGKEAIDFCLKNKISLILMDVKMPILNGYEACEIIKSQYPEIPIIIQTAYSSDNEKRIAKNHGCDEFISKPIDNEELIKLLNKYLK